MLCKSEVLGNREILIDKDRSPKSVEAVVPIRIVSGNHERTTESSACTNIEPLRSALIRSIGASRSHIRPTARSLVRSYSGPCVADCRCERQAAIEDCDTAQVPAAYRIIDKTINAGTVFSASPKRNIIILSDGKRMVGNAVFSAPPQ